MKKLACLWLLIAAGCASQPAGYGSISREKAWVAATPAPWTVQAWTLSPRIGVEYLPPEDALGTQLSLDAPLQARLPGTAPDATQNRIAGSGGEPEPSSKGRLARDLERAYAPPRYEGSRLPEWNLRQEHISSIDNTMERISMRFLRELMGEDRRRVQRALGSPIMAIQNRFQSTVMEPDYLDIRYQEDIERLVSEHGTRMLNRPLRSSLKELRVVTDFEMVLKEFKKSNMPLSGDYRESHGSRRQRGRLSIRVRASKLDNPLELSWIHSGWRVGSHLESFKLSYGKNVLEDLRLEMRSTYAYDHGETRVFGRLRYTWNKNTFVNFLIGNNIDIFSGPTSYPGGPPESDPTKAALFYVEHLF